MDKQMRGEEVSQKTKRRQGSGEHLTKETLTNNRDKEQRPQTSSKRNLETKKKSRQ